MPLLEASGLSSGYGSMPVLHDVDLRVEEREIVAVIGPNGAGKSTLTRALFRLLPAWRGTIACDGRDITALPPSKLPEVGMAYVPQEGNVFRELSVEENLRVSLATLPRGDRREMMRRLYELFPRLAERRRARARTLSGGERQMLAVASGMALRPRILVLDEPTSGMAPMVIQTLVERIVEVREGGTAVLWVIGEAASQVVEHLDRAYVLRAGEIAEEWDRAQLAAPGALESAFFEGAPEDAPRPRVLRGA